MTVIAYKNGTMAADKQSTFGYLKMRTTKIFRHDLWIAGGCGPSGKIREVHEWIENGMDPDALPAFQRVDEGCAQFLLAHPTGLFLMDSSHSLIKIEQDFYAAGSGRDFAMAAMHLGASAEEAVEIASIYSASCGMGIDVLTLAGGSKHAVAQ